MHSYETTCPELWCISSLLAVLLITQAFLNNAYASFVIPILKVQFSRQLPGSLHSSLRQDSALHCLYEAALSFIMKPAWDLQMGWETPNWLQPQKDSLGKIAKLNFHFIARLLASNYIDAFSLSFDILQSILTVSKERLSLKVSGDPLCSLRVPCIRRAK